MGKETRKGNTNIAEIPAKDNGATLKLQTTHDLFLVNWIKQKWAQTKLLKYQIKHNSKIRLIHQLQKERAKYNRQR